MKTTKQLNIQHNQGPETTFCKLFKLQVYSRYFIKKNRLKESHFIKTCVNAKRNCSFINLS